MTEIGKLKRLLIHKDKYKRSLYDILYYESEAIKENTVKKILIFNSFKFQEFKSHDEIESIFNDLSIIQFILDNFDYKKHGLSESLVRDINVILIGEISCHWKKKLL
jgi:hypothetical protein